jgi:hypothetical protein
MQQRAGKGRPDGREDPVAARVVLAHRVVEDTLPEDDPNGQVPCGYSKELCVIYPYPV